MVRDLVGAPNDAIRLVGSDRPSSFTFILFSLRSGKIRRQTISKKHGPQAWYDTTHSAWGDAFPHAAATSQVRTRGITKLTPANVKNKISIINGKVSGLEKLSQVEYREVAELMSALGVEVPERLGKRGQSLVKQKPKTGWDAPDGWGVGDQIYGYDGSEQAVKRREEEENLARILRSEGIKPPTKTRLRSEVEAEQRAALNEGKETVKWLGRDVVPAEWEATPLVGARVIDPAQYSRPDEDEGEDEEEDDGQGWGIADDDSEDFDVEAYLAKHPEGPDLGAAFDHSDASSMDGPIYPFRQPSPDLSSQLQPSSSSDLSDNSHHSLASPHFSIDDLKLDDPDSDLSTFSPASNSPKLALSNLGPGWMEGHDHELSPSEAKVAARDRMSTFKAFGIKVPDLVSSIPT